MSALASHTEYDRAPKALGLRPIDFGFEAREHGTDKDIRIVLCGYEGEHQMPGWTVYAWKALRGYGGADNDNRHKERLWLSPHCLPLLQKQRDLFVEEGGA